MRARTILFSKLSYQTEGLFVGPATAFPQFLLITSDTDTHYFTSWSYKICTFLQIFLERLSSLKVYNHVSALSHRISEIPGISGEIFSKIFASKLREI